MSSGRWKLLQTLIAWASCASAFPVRGQTGPLTLSFQDAVERGLAASAALRASTERIGAARGNLLQAGLSPNPRLILQHENSRAWGGPFSFPNDTDNFLYGSQVFEAGGKRGRRVEVASNGVRISEVQNALLARDIRGRIAAAYWTALGAQRAGEWLQQDLESFDGVVAFHRDRVREGAMAEVDLIRVRLERERLALSVGSALREAERDRIRLLQEMGSRQYPAIRFAEPLEPGPLLDIPDASRALERRPEIRLARASLEYARSMVRLQEANGRPDPELLFGYKRTSGMNTVIAGLQWNLPLRNRNQGAVEAANADLRAAEADMEGLETRLRAELEAAWNDYRLRRQQVDGPLGTIRGQAGETARIAEAAYREGATDLLRLLDARRARIEAELLYTRAISELRQSESMLLLLEGIE